MLLAISGFSFQKLVYGVSDDLEPAFNRSLGILGFEIFLERNIHRETFYCVYCLRYLP